MFQHFLKTIRSKHSNTVFSSIETIMTLVLEETESISAQLLSCLLDGVKVVENNILHTVKKLAEKVLVNCSLRLKPYLAKLFNGNGALLSDYNKIIANNGNGDSMVAKLKAEFHHNSGKSRVNTEYSLDSVGNKKKARSNSDKKLPSNRGRNGYQRKVKVRFSENKQTAGTKKQKGVKYAEGEDKELKLKEILSSQKSAVKDLVKDHNHVKDIGKTKSRWKRAQGIQEAFGPRKCRKVLDDTIVENRSPYIYFSSLKIEAVTRRILWIKSTDQNAKVLVFSSWNDVLDVLQHALDSNNISYVRMKGGRKSQAAIAQFKGEQPFKSKHIQVLLILIQHGSNGLNLLEAQHVILVEPLLNPAIEAQAIGRVHRIGQEKKTFVHRFIQTKWLLDVKNTVEESIYKLNLGRSGNSMVGTKANKKQDQPVLTVQDVESLFPTSSSMVENLPENFEDVNVAEQSLRHLPAATAAGLAAERRFMTSHSSQQ
ncbi:hypothetical protein IEQ34_002265 [Dendrobium chrysotoxum]|uniref:Helicase C-terminal domain-containing protein n=1 Tax=Dendrobium chrysotoxum TaxID=161865 RepID=A0AAV7HLS4_DENCH|nr:hypothetical protein IEQ34_002265 [Dendrobium chrysotoxum]